MKSPLTAAPTLAAPWVSDFPQKDSAEFTEKSVIHYIEIMEFISSIQQKKTSLQERDKNYIGLMRLLVGKESFAGRLSKPIMLQHCFPVYYLELVDLFLL